MGILDKLNATQENCETNGFDQEALEHINKIAHTQIYVGSDQNEYLDETNYQENNLFGIYNASDWRLFQTPIDKPFEEYDSDGTITYFWYYGDVIDLQFNLTGEIVVEDDAIVYYVTGQTPTETTVGQVNQKAYNIVDIKSWTLVAIEGTIYIWQEDNEYIAPITGNRHVYFSIQDYIKDKHICVKIQDFKYNTIYEQDYNGDQDILLHINQELSNAMVPGVYYVHIAVIDENSKNIIIGINKYRLLVK